MAWVSIDLETTGTDAATERIIEIGAVRFDRRKVIDRFHTLVNPGRAVPLRIERLTGIRSLELVKAPRFSDVRERLERFLGNDPLVGQNIGFDVAFLRAQGMPVPAVSYDTYELASVLLPEATEYNLSGLARFLGVDLPVAHRAQDDAEGAMGVFLALLDRAERLDTPSLEELLRTTSRVDWPPRRLLADLIRQRGSLTLPGEPAAITPAGVPVALRRIARPGGPQPIDGEALAGFFGPDGPLAAAFPGYEERAGQVAMMRLVAAAFNDDEHLVVEAGTGIGKSVAYLLPALVWALRNQETVVVSTNTINLQDQLIQKDIPDLLRVLAHAGMPGLDGVDVDDVRVSQLKGRTNYLCVRRWNHARRVVPDQLDEARVLARTIVWQPTTETGDRAELNLVQGEHQVWGRISAQPDNCLSSDCSVLREGRCYLAMARKRAESAHILVTNHALLLSDMAGEGRILPEYQRLIIDEAHHLEDQATSQFGATVSRADLLGLLLRIHDADSGPIAQGVVADIEAAAFDPFGVSPGAPRLAEAAARLRDESARARAAVMELFRRAGHFANQRGASEQDKRIRVTSAVREQLTWEPLAVAWQAADTLLQECWQLLGRLEGGLAGVAEGSRGSEVRLDVESIQIALDRAIAVLRECVTAPDPAGVYWIAPGSVEDLVSFARAPLSVDSLLEDGLFAQKSTVVMTSATLATGGSTDYFRRRVGAIEAREAVIPAPYDYRRAALLVIPGDMPEPNMPGYQEGLDRWVRGLALATEGHALVLFTSHASLRATYRACREALEEENILPLAQGIDGSPRQLLTAFRANPRAVLFGTSSFWEGVDVAGEALSLIVIARLPFAVPSDPIYQARSELFERPFDDYAVPQAVIRFKQGFGRLIRSRTDRGVVAVLDRRIETKSYGRLFLGALPDCARAGGSLDAVAGQVRGWLPYLDGSTEA